MTTIQTQKIPVKLSEFARITSDLLKTAGSLSDDSIRYLVDTYYQAQEWRKGTANQVRAAAEADEGDAALLRASAGYFDFWENEVRKVFLPFAEEHAVGRWAMAQVGIGPVLAAGLFAHIKLDKAPCVSSVWRFAGLDPTSTWEKGKKRPHNASLKTLCWKIGESFVKTCNHEDSFYGPVYVARKELETARNAAGAFAEQAAAKLARYKIGKNTEAYAHYAAGRLPPAHIHARAKRYAVKLFLSHYWTVLFESTHGTPAPKPRIFEIDPKHTHLIPPPGWSLPARGKAA